jgi:hypothetical protein
MTAKSGRGVRDETAATEAAAALVVRKFRRVYGMNQCVAGVTADGAEITASL